MQKKVILGNHGVFWHYVKSTECRPSFGFLAVNLFGAWVFIGGEAGYAKDLELAVVEEKRQKDFGIEMVPVADGAAFVKQANDAAWAAIDQASPKYAKELREKFGAAQ